jgi:hypothetical protein
MSLHKFADMVASKGRGDDSLLIHMTPDEVQRLQAFAQANGRSLTINPDTGLPEAGMLSDLFKMVAPIALGAFLGPAGMGISFGGLSSALSAGIATGGITTLATGSLSRGLMAGLGAYGGAGLGESLMGAGSTALSGAGAEAALQAPSVDAFVGNAEGMTSGDAFNNFLKSDANPAVMGKTDVLSAGAKAAAADPLGFAKSNLGNLAYAAAPIMAGAMVPTTTKLPEPRDSGLIRQMAFNINPDTGRPDPLYGMREMTPVKTSEFGNKTFKGQRDLFYQQNPNPYELGVGSLNQPPQQQPAQMNTGGIVALAEGGIPRYNGSEDSQIFDYFKGLDQGKVQSGALDQQIARAMETNDWTAADIGRATGTQDRVADYGTRFTAADTKNDIYDYFADPTTQALLGTGAAGDAAIAKTLQDRDWTLANVAAATGTQGQLGDYGTRFVNSILQPGITSNQFNAYTADVGLTGQNLANALANSGLSASAQYALTHNLNDTGIDYRNLKETDFYKNLGYTKGTAPGDVGGLKGLYDNINYAAKSLQGQMATGQLTGQQARNAATTEMNRIGVSAADVKAATGKTITELFPDTITKLPPLPPPTPFTSVIPTGPTGRPDGKTPGDITTNPDGSVTVHPNIPYRPDGGFSGIGEVRDAWEAGGGSLGYTSPVVKTAAEHEAAYNKLTDDSLDAYRFLMGEGKNLTQRKAETRDRPVMQRYDEAVLGRKTPRPVAKTTGTTGTTGTTKVLNSDGTVNQEETDKANFDYAAYLKANPDVQAELDKGIANFGTKDDLASAAYNHYVTYGKAQKRPLRAAEGGMMGYAMGGGLGSLGSYSDGGRLLKGPGDGVSDSIPATIGRNRQPARLADGEFVIPARIVSELGNGSTDAGAKKLYAMMDRVQRARGKTTGKNKVAANSRSDKSLPA